MIDSLSRANNRRGIAQGACVVVVLREPREKYWGRLEEVNTAGVFLRGLDLSAFDDWMGSVARGETDIAPTDVFFPLWRVERITSDETVGAVRALHDQFRRRTGLSVDEVLDYAPAKVEAENIN